MRPLRWIAAILLLLGVWIVFLLPAVGFVVSLYPEPQITAPEGTFAEADGVATFGASQRTWVGAPNDGVWSLRLVGDPVQRGWAQGVLIGERTHVLEAEMMQTFVALVPGWLARHLIVGVVGLNNRSLPSYFRDVELLEIAAETDGSAVQWGAQHANQPHYQRAVQYHSLHDVSHYLIDNPLVRVPQIGCTAIAVGGHRTADGRILAGRLFDFEGGEAFDRDKVVQTVIPDDGIPYLSVAWPGAVGAVTGMNQAGLWVSLNAADTAGGSTVGRPTILAAREILETCHTIAEAVAVLRRTPVFVSETVLLASGDERRAVAAELGPHGLFLRDMSDDKLVATNQFLCPEWADDPVNRDRAINGTSAVRAERAHELLDALDQATPLDVLNILRDRRGVGGVDLGFGNRGTINAWIGAHLAVADLQSRTLWVCGTWHGLGTARAFRLSGARPDLDLPASSDLAVHDRNALRWAQLLRTANTMRSAGRDEEARTIARDAAALNPMHWASWLALAETTTDPQQRKQFGERARAALPPYPNDRARVRDLLESTP